MSLLAAALSSSSLSILAAINIVLDVTDDKVSIVPTLKAEWDKLKTEKEKTRKSQERKERMMVRWRSDGVR